jgi:hypothetical protein
MWISAFISNKLNTIASEVRKAEKIKLSERMYTPNFTEHGVP